MYALSGLQKTGSFNRLQRLCRPDKHSASGKFADKAHFVYAGCGVYALSGLQKQAVSIDCRDYVGLISAAHQASLLTKCTLFMYAGCGVYALSGLQKQAVSIDCRDYVGLISAAHQAS
ncbi:hypothetical protein KVP97_03405, partial [Escherichia coli]|nr:hypothetical protein [Escherichia coli]